MIVAEEREEDVGFEIEEEGGSVGRAKVISLNG